MGAFAGLDDAIAKATDPTYARAIRLSKTGRVNSSSPGVLILGHYSSLWNFDGYPGVSLSAPGAVAAPDNTTTNGLKQADPGGGRQLWLVGGHFVANLAGTLVLYDRLLHQSGLSGTSTGVQTVGGTITRYTGAEAVGNIPCYEIYGALGSTSVNMTLNYTDQDGNAASFIDVIGSAGKNELYRLQPVSVAPGDSGVRGVTSVQLAATTGTTGDFGITIVRFLASWPLPILARGLTRSFLNFPCKPVEIKPGACLSLAWIVTGAGSAVAPEIDGYLHFIEA